jgi:hypothetical protein
LVWVVKVVPLIRELLAETEGPVVAERLIECLDHLLAVLEAVQGGVFDCE